MVNETLQVHKCAFPLNPLRDKWSIIYMQCGGEADLLSVLLLIMLAYQRVTKYKEVKKYDGV